MNIRIKLLAVILLVFCLLALELFAGDPPHNNSSNVNCSDCHGATLLKSQSPFWTDNTTDAAYCAICLRCHALGNVSPYNAGNAPPVDTHKAIKCTICHHNHDQDQIYSGKNNTSNFFLAKGAATSAIYDSGSDTTTITYSTLEATDPGSDWAGDLTLLAEKTGSGRGGLLIPDTSSRKRWPLYIITAIDSPESNTILVKGNATAATNIAITYGQLVRRQVLYDPVHATSRSVKLYNRQGAYSFAHNNQAVDVDPPDTILDDSTPDGICQVCHENTNHWRNDGTKADNHYSGENCMQCHQHTDGFAHGGAAGGAGCGTAIECHGEHEPHTTHIGPLVGIECSDCHDTNDYPYFASGTDGNGDGKYDLSETDICDNCHSTDGLANAKTYFDYETAGGRWTDVEGQDDFCGSCHDATPGNSQGNGLGDDALNIMGDTINYGYFITGHGKASGNYQRLSWQDTASIGNPAANKGCGACHDLASGHFDNAAKRLIAGFENDQNNSNCNKCHPSTANNSATADPQWYTVSDDYEGSAHGSTLCTNCHDVHGASGNNPAMTTANQESLCYQCHTDGMLQNNAISGSVDDIQEAFSQGEKHNLGSLFSVGGKDYSLECISCHNVHLVTGKYWDAENNKTPVTRFSNNTEVWGDEPGEKTYDFAALAAGSGGFYYKTAQGYSLGATGLPFDQPARYQPPKKTSGYDWEFGGDDLPDYTSFCLDCHSSRMADDVGAVNWGQGISGGFPDPAGPGYSNWVNTSAPHGLDSANMSSYISDSGTPGNWGTSGNPDVLFDMNYVTRGRHTGHFMRWPYDSADRSAGINFVMACTDCHEAHGSSVNSMLRTTVNTGPGSGTWNTMCNNCHYYYGGQHEGMSCATASCHEGYSIHRIKKNGGGGPTQLMLTSSGYESNYMRPDFTPEIEMVSSHIGSNELTVTFRESRHGGTPGLYGRSDLTGSLGMDDFRLFDKGGNNPRTITDVTHTAGEMTATLTMSAPVVEADLSTDTLAMKPASAWAWYVGGYVNAATGTLPAEAVSAGPWPATVTGPSAFNIQGVLYGRLELKVNGIVEDSNQMYVTFAESAYATPNTTGALQVADFVVVCGAGTVSSVTHTAGETFAILTMDAIVNQSEIGVCTVAAAAGSIYDSYGNPADTGAVTLALPPEASVNDLILHWNFNEASGNAASTGALGTQEDMHGLLTRNAVRAATTIPGKPAADNVVKFDRISDRGAVQLNYTVNPDDGFPPATYNSGGAPVIVQEMEKTSEFSFSVWIKPTGLGCSEGQTLGLNTKLRRDVLTTQFWIKNWALGIMRFTDGDPINGDCTAEDSTHDVLRFWVAVGDPTDMRCDAWGGSWPEYVQPVSPAGYTQGSTLMPTDQAVCDSSATPILPTNTQAHSFAQTETSASGAPTYGGVALQPGVWQHVVGTWDGRYIRIYIDGQLAAETDMGGSGNYVMVADPHLWGGDLVGDGSITRHVSSFFAAGARPLFSASGSPSDGAVYWNTNGFYDLNSYTFVGELDDVKYWQIALPLTTIQN